MDAGRWRHRRRHEARKGAPFHGMEATHRRACEAASAQRSTQKDHWAITGSVRRVVFVNVGAAKFTRWTRRARERPTGRRKRAIRICAADHGSLRGRGGMGGATMMTQGRRSLLALLQLTSGCEIAARCRVAKSSVSQWASGQKNPCKATRERLERQYGIRAESWTDNT